MNKCDYCNKKKTFEKEANTITPETIKCLGYAFGNMERLFKSGYENGLKGTKKIEKIDEILRIDGLQPPYDLNTQKIWKNIIIQQNKINEIIDYLKGDSNE